MLLIGHGSASHAAAGRVLLEHAKALETELGAGRIGVGFLAGSPTPAQALARLTATTVHVVPFFMEHGYFSRQALPRALSPAAGHAPRAGQTVRLHKPVGTHPDMTDLIVRRARDACRQAETDAAAVALVLVGHGSARAPGRTLALHVHAGRVRVTGGFASVQAACLEEPPFVPDVLARLRNGPVAILGLFAGEGMHVAQDLPGLIAAARSQRSQPVLDLGFIGADAGMRRIIRATIDAAGDCARERSDVTQGRHGRRRATDGN